MRSTVFSRVLALGLLCFFAVQTSISKAQIADPYPFTNHLPCQLHVEYTIYEHDPVTGACSVACFVNTVGIGVGGPPFLITWPGAPVCGCGVQIRILAVNGVPLVPPLAAASPGMPVPPFPFPQAGAQDPSGCSPTGFLRLAVLPGGAMLTP